MGIKSKVFGFVAAGALSLSMVAGVAADTVGGSVTLAGNGCSIEVTETDISFGTWQWNGDSYEVVTPNSNISTVNASLDPGSPTGTCHAVIDTLGLQSGTSIINKSHLKISNNTSSFAPFPMNTSDLFAQGFGEQEIDLFIKLMDVPNTYAPGTYNGTFTFTVSQANP